MTYLVCGEALIDLIKQPNGSWIAHNGGGPLNTAKALAQLGEPTEFLGRISKDTFGNQLLAEINHYGVGTKYLISAAEPTSMAVVQLDATGSASYSFYLTQTSNFSWQTAELPTQIADLQAIHIGTLALVIPPSDSILLNWFNELDQRPLVMIDLNVRPSVIPDSIDYRIKLEPWLEFADVLKVSEEDLLFLYPDQGWQEVANILLKRYPISLISVTLGSSGAALVTRDLVVFENAPKVNVIDTVGAGDTFSAALLHKFEKLGLLSKGSLADINSDQLQTVLHFAVNAAALSCTKAGAVPPTLHEIESFLNDN
jgi:fructokinase